MAIIKYKNKTTGEWDSIPALQGADGKSAYEIACNNGFQGTEEEWLGSLKGTDGKDGVNGTNGTNGENGRDGSDGISITNTEINADGELIIYYSDGNSDNLGKVIGTDGQDGTDGADGTNGTDGEDGIGITNVTIDTDGQLIIHYSNNTSQTVGKVVGADGKDGTNGTDGKDGTNGKDGVDGIGIFSSEITTDGELVLTYSNNQTSNLGKVVGKDGENGENGEDGVGISKTEINAEGELVITYSNGTIDILSKVVGANGTNGTNGKDGENGVDGKDGISIVGASINTSNELVLTFSNDTEKNLGVVVGVDGIDGSNGKDGEDGKSAYEIAQEQGFEGTEAEWLKSLKCKITVILISDNDSSDEIQEQFDKIYENEYATVLCYESEDSYENYRTYYPMKGYTETSERVFASIDVDNQIHIVKYTNFGASREIYTQNACRTEVVMIFDDDREEEIQTQRDLMVQFTSNYNEHSESYIYPFVINYNNELYTLSRVDEESSYIFVCATEQSIKQLEYRSDNTRVFSEVKLDSFITSDYFNSDEFANKVIAALPVAENTLFPVEEATE